MNERPMTTACAVLHLDAKGSTVPCPGYPHQTETGQQDTGRRCPRCDCPDGHKQCDHCKSCPHACVASKEPS